jgi:hypothetical protein
MSTAGDALGPRLDLIQGRALIAGAAGLGVCLVAALVWPHLALPSYLVAYLFWVGIAMGCVALTLLHHLVGGGWGLPIRRPLEAGAMALLPMAVLFVPILLGIQTLYPWAQPDRVQADRVLQHKSPYLNVNGFALRAVGYFVLWIALAYLLSRWSLQQDRSADPAPTRRLQALSGPGLVLVFLTATFAAIDWGMSLEPHWYSTIYGAMLIVGWGLTTFALMILVATLLSHYEPIASVATPTRMQDLGNLMLAFVMLWAYMAFSQFLIIWSGNLVEEIPWYLRRTRGGWEWVALALIVFHFFAPFFALLFRDTKRNLAVLRGVAAAILVMHVVDLTWLVVPARFDREGTTLRPWIPWGELTLILPALLGIGGIWVAAFLWYLKGRPLVPLHGAGIDLIEENNHAEGGH